MNERDIEDFIEYYTTGKRRKCSHPWQHTVYGASEPARNGTTCVICGEAAR